MQREGVTNGTKYSGMDQVKFVEDSLLKKILLSQMHVQS